MTLNLRKISYYLISIFVIMLSTVEWKYLEYISYPSKLIKLFFILSVLAGVFLTNGNLAISKKNIVLCIYLSIYLFIYMLATRYNVRSFCINFLLNFILLTLLTYSLIERKRMTEFLKSFENIILIISAVTLFFWLFGSVLDILPGRQEIVYYWAQNYKIGYTYYHIYFENLAQNQDLFGLTIPRNCGIFTEVPAFSGFLLYALLIELFAHKRPNKVRTLLLLSTILSTQSTKAYTIVLILFLVLFLYPHLEKPKARVKLSTLCILVPVVITVYNIIEYILVDKSTTSSFAVRMSDVVASLEAWLRSPIFGVGYGNNSAVAAFNIVQKSNAGLSMGLTVLLAQGGLFLMALYLFAFFLPFKHSAIVRDNKKGFMCILVVLLLNLLVSNSWTSIPYIFIICSGVVLVCYRDKVTSSSKN